MAMRDPDNAHWRDSARVPKFFFMDAYAAMPLLICLLHIRLWTFLTAIGFTCFFVIIQKFGFTLPVFFRFLRSFIAGNRRHTIPWWAENKIR